jgi:PHD/YefM family antitoxin component YafN of YafNO toxin-antitoxin module
MATLDRPTVQPLQLEEDIEFSNVTTSRESFLTRVEGLRENPAKRYVITKHGQPQAVLMSFQTYSLLKRAMDQALARTAARSSSEAIHAAFDRLRSDQEGESAQIGAVGKRHGTDKEAILQTVQSLRSQVEYLSMVLEKGNF